MPAWPFYSVIMKDHSGFSLFRLHVGWGFVPPPYGGGQVHGDKVLMGGFMTGGHRPYGGDLTLIDYIIN